MLNSHPQDTDSSIHPSRDTGMKAVHFPRGQALSLGWQGDKRPSLPRLQAHSRNKIALTTGPHLLTKLSVLRARAPTEDRDKTQQERQSWQSSGRCTPIVLPNSPKWDWPTLPRLQSYTYSLSQPKPLLLLLSYPRGVLPKSSVSPPVITSLLK